MLAWNPAKQESMKERKHPLVKHAIEMVQPPAFPTAGNKIFERIGTAVSASRGYPLDNLDFARLIGRPQSTTSYWFGVSPQPHLVSFFCLLEQLPPPDRHRVIDSLCRDLPVLDHPRLRHNPVAVAMMKNLLTQNIGLTLLTGGTDEQRTFVITAMGHTFCRVDRRHRTAAGLDSHEPDWFVPIETLLYLNGQADSARAGGLILRLWPQVASTKKPLVLLNGIWTAMPELHNDILSLAQRRHVIVADQEISLSARTSLRSEHPLHILAVSSARENLNWIAVQTAGAG